MIIPTYTEPGKFVIFKVCGEYFWSKENEPESYGPYRFLSDARKAARDKTYSQNEAMKEA